MVKEARVKNHVDGITGLLVFDGASFLQLVQGPVDSIGLLMKRLQADLRHEDMETLLFTQGEGPLHFPDWGLGYLLHEHISIARFRGMQGPEALAAFLALVPKLDIYSGAPIQVA